MNNWYSKLPAHLQQSTRVDKHYKRHHVKPRSMITCIGGTGSGKTNALLDFLSKKDDAFYEIVLFNPVSTDEPIYNLMREKIPEMKVFTDINELPELESWSDENNGEEKLIIFDDFINLKPKEMKKIQKYYTGGRKKGFTCFCMGQNYTSIPKTITRNTHYYILFKLNDTHTASCILKNHNIENVKKDDFLDYYLESVREPLNFFMIDLRGGKETHLRKNWDKFFKIEKN